MKNKGKDGKVLLRPNQVSRMNSLFIFKQTTLSTDINLFGVLMEKNSMFDVS